MPQFECTMTWVVEADDEEGAVDEFRMAMTDDHVVPEVRLLDEEEA